MTRITRVQVHRSFRFFIAWLSVASCSVADPDDVSSASSIEDRCAQPVHAELAESKKTGSASLTGSFALASYVSDAKKVLDENCASSGCHDGVNQPPDLTTYASASAQAARIKARITDAANPMPASGQMEQALIDTLVAWVDEGTPENDSVPSDGAGADDGGSAADGSATDGSSSEDGGDGQSVPAPVVEGLSVKGEDGCYTPVPQEDLEYESKYLGVVRRDAVATCHAQNLMFDRNQRECAEISVKIDFPCTPEGAATAFASANVDAQGTLETSIGVIGDEEDTGEGYQLDQCGRQSDGNPVVTLIKFVDNAETGEPELQVRVLGP